MIRRLPPAPVLFFLLWALWFLLPSTREMALSQWKSRFWTIPTIVPISANDPSRDEALVGAIRQEDRGIAGALESLGARFPKDVAICAAQIMATSGELNISMSRQPGPSSSGELNWSVRLVKLRKPSPRVLKSWFAAAERGAKLEPNNTFWDWAKIMGLLAARRDDEIWPVLHSASLKTVYDDHTTDVSLTRIRVARKQRGVIIAPIQETNIAASISFPHFAVMREAARQVSDDASGLRLSGEPLKQKRALEGLRDMVLVGRIMRRTSKTLLESLVGQAVEGIGLFGGSYSPRPSYTVRHPRLGQPVAAYASDPRSLLAFARQMNRNDIVAQLSRDWVELGFWRHKESQMISQAQVFSVGWSTSDFVLAQMADWFGSLLIGGIPTLLVVALICTVLVRFVPAWRRERDLPLSPSSWGGTIFSFVTVLVFSVPALVLLWNEWHTVKATGYLLFLSVPLYGELSGDRSVPLVWQYHFPALLGISFALWRASIWYARRQGKPTLWARLRRLFVQPDEGLSRFDVSPLLALAGLLAVWAIIIVGGLGALVLPLVNDTAGDHQTTVDALVLGIAVGLLLLLVCRLRSVSAWMFACTLAHRLLWGQLLAVTVLWGVLALVGIPAQHRFDAAYERRMQIGELPLMRQILKF